MTDLFSVPATATHYWLTNAHIPVALLDQATPAIEAQHSREGLARVDIEIRDGVIVQVQPAAPTAPAVPAVDLQQGIVFPCFVDMHTHLDKGHIFNRAPNLDGSFETALTIVQDDRLKRWHPEDVYRRMEFGLKCAYAHGTSAIRTHLDAIAPQDEISFAVFQTLRREWADRVILQAVSLVSIDYFLTPAGEPLADRVAEAGGLLGAVLFMNPDLDAQLDRIFQLAQERHLNLDFHADESGNPSEITLRRVAEAAERNNFAGQIVCGHCCSLATQSPAEAQKTIDRVKQANIGIVSLPMCNLYLQDRNQQSSQNFYQGALDSFKTHTPRWRGVTLLHELKQSGIPVAVASDNCRDPFYGFGDHDGLEVLTQATRIVHFDAPYGDWCRTVTTTPADLMGLPTIGRIAIGLPADLVVFKARYFSELFARPQSDRLVLRQGHPIDTTLPDYAELDDLLMQPS